MISRFAPVCICLQETKLGELTHSSPPGYRTFFSTPIPNQGHHGGTAILVRNDIPYIEMQLHSPLQVVAVKKKMINRFYTVCSLYLPPNDRIHRNELDTLLTSFTTPFLLLGDFNSRHYL